MATDWRSRSAIQWNKPTPEMLTLITNLSVRTHSYLATKGSKASFWVRSTSAHTKSVRNQHHKGRSRLLKQPLEIWHPKDFSQESARVLSLDQLTRTFRSRSHWGSPLIFAERCEVLNLYWKCGKLYTVFMRSVFGQFHVFDVDLTLSFEFGRVPAWRRTCTTFRMMRNCLFEKSAVFWPYLIKIGLFYWNLDRLVGPIQLIEDVEFFYQMQYVFSKNTLACSTCFK